MIRTKIIDHYTKKASVDLKLLNKSSSRNDLLQFLKYLEKVIRYLQLIYLIKEEKPVVSTKHFEKRFAKIENGNITKLIRKISSKVNMNEVNNDVLKMASSFGIEQSEKFKA